MPARALVRRGGRRLAPVLARDIGNARPWRVFATLSHSARNAIESDLVRITVPTLVLTGERDPIAPPRWREQAARLVPDADLMVVPRAAHNVATTAATEVANAVRHLLALDPALTDR
ncbi:alpha/beta hydrolase [Micromonospora sp. WMMD710]|uniref:alpha/beta fold hydrolase n=1 Tax=Micromonospora sp. WMMD710 TaxID=3016085 RepID=UPI002415A91F|nr:alpha/beta hydrolase [Micromonospora sp. WMMD710]MDG4759217.1 alpha/beta hydrolase [Micromonospora sp. WMMD710]